MLTIVIPNRNRDLNTVQRTLSSLHTQCDKAVTIVVVDYGSESSYQGKLKELIDSFKDIVLMMLPTQGQLWQKTRAINIALKQCTTPFFMVADMDMLFHPAFIQKASSLASKDASVYFQVGILTEEESAIDKPFDTYAIKFKTNKEATGMTLFPTETLLSINGFDEFYHGWGAEDTDVHVRLRNAGHTVTFYDTECLLLHQWHPKFYRSKDSMEPFHSTLEKINHRYLSLSRKLTKTLANQTHPWGCMVDEAAHLALSQPEKKIAIKNLEDEVQALCAQIGECGLKGIVHIVIEEEKIKVSLKSMVKKQLGKVKSDPISLVKANDLLLETIIKNCRHLPYHYAYDRTKNRIECTINFSDVV